MILESRKYAVHDPHYNYDNNNIRDNNDDNNDSYDNKNDYNNSDDNNNTIIKDKNEDKNKNEGRNLGDVKDREMYNDGVMNDKVKSKGEGARTNSVTCTYYRPVLVIREEASKYGVRRACVLLGENGAYVRVYVLMNEHD